MPLNRLLDQRDRLLDRFAEAITIEDGRRHGSTETRVALDLRYPDVAHDQRNRAERWRLCTARHRLARAPFSRPALTAFHSADAQKGRRLTAVDLRNENRVAALMAWHFEARPPQRGTRKPHLIVALSPADVRGALRAEYLVACWLLCLVGLAIDRRTVEKGRIGVVLDAGIAVTGQTLAEMGFRPGRKRDGYLGHYLELSA